VYNFAAPCCKKQQKQFLTILILEIKKASLANKVQLNASPANKVQLNASPGIFFCTKITGFLGSWK